MDPISEYTNIVSNGQFISNRTIDLRYVCVNAKDVEYSPNRSSALKMKFRSCGTTVQLWSSGKFNILGSNSMDNSIKTVKKMKKILERCGYSVKINEEHSKLVSVTGSIDYSKLVKTRLEENILMAIGLVLSPSIDDKRPTFITSIHGTTVLIYKSGKITIKSSRDFETFDEIKKTLTEIFEEYEII